MNCACLSRTPARVRFLFSGYMLLVLAACQSGESPGLEQQQTANMLLTKTLHKHLNNQNWQAAGTLCADRVRYRDRTMLLADVEESRAWLLDHYRYLHYAGERRALEIRQLYPAGKYHVIVEGLTRGDPPDTTRPVCLIYTIEHNRITRLYAY